MGACCSAHGTADGTATNPGAPGGHGGNRHKMSPASAPGNTPPAANSRAATPPPAPAAPEAEKVKPAPVANERKEEKPPMGPKPPSPPTSVSSNGSAAAAHANANASAAPEGPPAARPDRASSTAAAAAPPSHTPSTEAAAPTAVENTAVIPHTESVAEAVLGNSAAFHLPREEPPTAREATREFRSGDELDGSPTLSTAMFAPAVENDGEEEEGNTAAADVNATPERQGISKGDHEDDPTRGPSTARVEEVPPTPVHESEAATGKALPADDERVLLRVPPPPPPPSTSAAGVLKACETEAPEQHEKGEQHDDSQKAVADANPLADIIRRQQEEKQRYPTALTTDAADDAPLEIRMDEERSDGAAAAVAATMVSDALDVALAKHEQPHAESESAPPHNAQAVHHDPNATTAKPQPPKPEVLYKLLRYDEWMELCEHGELTSTPDDETDGCLTFSTTEQVTQAVKELDGDDTRLVLLACSTEALSQPAASQSSGSLAPQEPALRWESSPGGTSATPRLHRALNMQKDVLFSKECVNADDVIAKLHSQVIISDSDDGREDVAEKATPAAAAQESNGNKPISFTDTSEIERELAGEDDEDEGGRTPYLAPPAEPADAAEEAHPAAAAQAADKPAAKADELNNDDDRPQPIVKSALQAVAMAAPLEPAREILAPSQHAAAAMQAPEAEQRGEAAAAAPRRVPPPLPLVQDGEATPPPSRAAPPTILSPFS